MNPAEARRIAGDVAAELRQMDYERVRAGYGDRPRCRVILGQGGVTYQVEVRADPADPADDHGRDLRVAVTVDDGERDPDGPVVEEFLVSADDSCVSSVSHSP
ncbi:MAG: hypothetical protein GEV03_01465 [Streptosporangiales bacterium]|nr:hypothetical protein [Streptosporangiales bacterium]